MSNFKKAFKTTILLVVAFLLLSYGIMEAYFCGENYFYQDYRERNELSGTLTYLICGSSHSLRDLRSDIIDEELGVNCYNISSEHITMQGRYELLALELARNPVDTVVLEFSYSSMTRTRDTGYEGNFYLLAKLDNTASRLSYFFRNYEPSEYVSIFYEYINKGVEAIKWMASGSWSSTNSQIIKGYAAYTLEPINFEYPTMLNIPKTSIGESTWFLDTIEEFHRQYRLKNEYNTARFNETMDDENIEYLQKIIELCQSYDVNLTIVALPLTESLICRYSNLDTFREFYKEMADSYGVDFIDFNLCKEKTSVIPDSTSFYDNNHLTVEGAEAFTYLYTDIFNRINSGEDVSWMFYDSYEELDLNQAYSS